MVDSARVPRVAAPEPTRCHQAATQGPVASDRLGRVGGTARVEPAALRQDRRDEQLIGLDQHEERPGGDTPDGLHVHPFADVPDEPDCGRCDRLARGACPSSRASTRARRRSYSVASSAYSACAAGGFARTSTSTPSGRSPRVPATWPRSLRLTRLRVTAPPTARETTNPTRGGSSRRVPTRTACTTTRCPPARRPRSARRISVESRSRCRAESIPSGVVALMPTGWRGPYGGDPPGWRDRHGWPCGGGSRASWRGDGCWAGRCACSRCSPMGFVDERRSSRFDHDEAFASATLDSWSFVVDEAESKDRLRRPARRTGNGGGHTKPPVETD